MSFRCDLSEVQLAAIACVQYLAYVWTIIIDAKGVKQYSAYTGFTLKECHERASQ